MTSSTIFTLFSLFLLQFPLITVDFLRVGVKNGSSHGWSIEYLFYVIVIVVHLGLLFFSLKLCSGNDHRMC